jgi:hypothetical protein
VCFYIGIEDLAANALIEVFKKHNKRFLSYDVIEKYGAKVVQLLIEKEEKAVLILSRDNTNALFRNYSEYFKEVEQDNKIGIALAEDKSIDDLIERFRGYLSLSVLLAFVDKCSVSLLE